MLFEPQWSNKYVQTYTYSNVTHAVLCHNGQILFFSCSAWSNMRSRRTTPSSRIPLSGFPMDLCVCIMRRLVYGNLYTYCVYVYMRVYMYIWVRAWTDRPSLWNLFLLLLLIYVCATCIHVWMGISTFIHVCVRVRGSMFVEQTSFWFPLHAKAFIYVWACTRPHSHSAAAPSAASARIFVYKKHAYIDTYTYTHVHVCRCSVHSWLYFAHTYTCMHVYATYITHSAYTLKRTLTNRYIDTHVYTYGGVQGCLYFAPLSADRCRSSSASRNACVSTC